jgi:cell division protein FtsB
MLNISGRLIYWIIISALIIVACLFLYLQSKKSIKQLEQNLAQALTESQQLKTEITSLQNKIGYLENRKTELVSNSIEQAKLTEKNKRI